MLSISRNDESKILNKYLEKCSETIPQVPHILRQLGLTQENWEKSYRRKKLIAKVFEEYAQLFKKCGWDIKGQYSLEKDFVINGQKIHFSLDAENSKKLKLDTFRVDRQYKYDQRKEVSLQWKIEELAIKNGFMNEYKNIYVPFKLFEKFDEMIKSMRKLDMSGE